MNVGHRKTGFNTEFDQKVAPEMGHFFRKSYEHLVQLGEALLNLMRDYLVTRQAAKATRFISLISRS